MDGRRVVVAALVAVTLGACQTADDGGGEGNSSDDLPPERYAYIVTDVEGGDTASMDGRLVDVDGCLLVETGEDDLLTLPVFPYGMIESDGLGFQIHFNTERYGVQSVQPGEIVHLGGGYSFNPPAASVVLPEACEDWDQIFYVANIA